MNTFDKYLFKKDNLLRRRIEIDNSLYEQLVKLTEIYDTSINKLVNIAIIEMIRTENVNVYEKPENEIVEAYWETLHACDNWSETLCLNESCPHFAENKNYIRILQDYKTVCDMKKRFWREKFNRTK